MKLEEDIWLFSSDIVVLAAGAINTPRILQNNGIGNQLKLKELGINHLFS